MQGRIGFVAVWIATTAAGMAISWAGVGDALRGTALPTQDLAAEVPVHQGRPPTTEPSPAPTPTSTLTSTPSPTAAASSAAAQASPTRKPPATPAAKPSSARPSARPPATTAPEGDVRTYVVKSGRVVLSLSADSARLVSATPNSGFQAKVWRQDEWLRVDLTDGVKGSAVFAKWNGHPPLVQVYEY